MTDRTVALSEQPFGPQLKGAWLLDPSITYLNHGTVGATPVAVLDAQRRLQNEIEQQPAQFLLRELSAIRVGYQARTANRLRKAAADTGRFIGAESTNLVFVDNATAGINAVLRSLALHAKDEIAVLDLAYGAVVNAATFAARTSGARVVTIGTCAPYSPETIVAAVDRHITDRTRIVVADHITAESALVLPAADIAALCRSRGVLCLIDGAHAPGALALDIQSIGADFYTANLHKWAWAPRSCGVLWVAREHHGWMHPPVISWGLDQGFTTEFDWVGTRDPTAFLAAPAAFALMKAYGAERVRAYNHDLAWRGARALATRWDTSFNTPESMIGTMATVPLPNLFGSTAEDAALLRDALLFADGIEVQVHAWRGRLWIRISAQIYNDMTDIERLADAVDRRAN